MKPKVLSIISFILSAIIAFSLSACTPQTKNPIFGKVDISLGAPLNSDGDFNYSIVRSKDASKEVEDMVKDLRTAIRLNFKTSVKISRDTVDYDENQCEILIGKTNRPESEAAEKLLVENRSNNSKDFIVKVDGKKIVINAMNEESLQKALKFFEESFCQSEETWYYLYNEYSFLYEPELDDSNHTIAGEPISKFNIVTSSQSSRIVTDQIEKFTDKLLEKSGFTMNVSDDSVKPAKYEIIIGNTNRSEKIETPEAGTYTIAVKGKKLVINGGDEASLAGAIEKLCLLYDEAVNSKKAMTFAQDYVLTENYDPGKDGYKLVWGDEFNGNELNRKLWVNSGEPSESASCLGTKSKARKSEECYVENGNAVIWASHDPVTDDFTHRQISTDGTHMFLYGCMEIRAKLAEAPAANALWFNAVNDLESYGCKQEIDLLEDFGKGTSFAANIHRWWTSQTSSKGHTSLDGGAFSNDKKYKVPDGGALSDEYHIFSFQWTPKIMNFCIDGKVFFSYDIENDIDDKGVEQFHIPMHTLMSTTLGAATYGAKWTREDKDRYELYIDYIRLYQRDSDGGYSKETLKN